MDEPPGQPGQPAWHGAPGPSAAASSSAAHAAAAAQPSVLPADALERKLLTTCHLLRMAPEKQSVLLSKFRLMPQVQKVETLRQLDAAMVHLRRVLLDSGRPNRMPRGEQHVLRLHRQPAVWLQNVVLAIVPTSVSAAAAAVALHRHLP